MLLLNIKFTNLLFSAALLLFVDLVAAFSSVLWAHWQGGCMWLPPLSTPLAMKCLNHGSWLRSAWKAFPFGPQFACALGAPTHTCTRPLMLTDLTNQPRRSQERSGWQGGGRATWTVDCGAPRAVASMWTEPVFSFIQSAQEPEGRDESQHSQFLEWITQSYS